MSREICFAFSFCGDKLFAMLDFSQDQIALFEVQLLLNQSINEQG